MKTKTAPEQLFFCVAEKVTRNEIPEFAGRAVEPLNKALKAAGLEQSGPLHFICPEWQGSESKNRLVIGIPIHGEKPVPNPYFIWKAPAFLCASTEYKGSILLLSTAWDSFVSTNLASGLKPSGGWREVYKHVESIESGNNLIELQAGIQ